MQKFKEMVEARGDTAVFTFGRLNPPTIGHGKLIDAMAKQQSKNSGSEMHIFVSHSQDAKKNPLSYNKKVAYIRKMFPKYAKNVLTSKARTIFEVAVALHDKGYKAIVMVVGSDRVAEFEKLLNEYNGVESRHGYYGFDNIEVVSAGERDPDAEGATGMSASKMRAAAVEGDFESFKKGLPSTFKDDKKIYQDIRKEMGIREQRDMGSMDVYEEMRDEYLTGKIWNVGDTIEANGKVGEIVRKGTNYVSYVTEDGKVHKAWLHHIELKERDYRKEYDNYHSKPEQVERRSSRNKARRVMGDKTKKGMDVGHKDNNPLNNSPKNLRNEDPSKNRREPRLREANAPDIKKGDTIILSKSKRPYSMAGITDPKTILPAESDKMVVHAIRKTKDGRKAHLRYHDPKKRGGFAIYLDKMPDFMSVKIAEEVELDEMSWFMKAKAKIDQMSHPKAYEAMVKKFIGDMKTPSNKKKTPSSIAAKIAREYSVPSRGLIQYINKLVDKGVLPKELKAEYQVESFSDFVAKINEVKQDSDIKDRTGTQPAKYYAKDAEGDEMSPATKKKRDSHFKAKKSGPAPGDSGAETRPSKHTQKFKRMYGEKLGKDADQGDYIDDFQKSDAPQFKGKSKEKRKDMAIAAYLSKNESLLDNVNKLLSESGHTDVASMKNKVTIALKALQKMDSELSKLGDEDDLPTWWTNKVATAVSRIDDMADYLDSQVDESLWANIHKKRKEGRPMRKKGEKGAPTAAQMKRAKGEEIEEDIELNEWGEIEEESEYQGRKVTLNKPTAGDVKKSKVYVKNEKGTVVKVNFGDKNMTIKKNIPARRKSFRARHNCDNPGPKWKARYWSCKAW
jgi:nicotinamide mononucleotide adenylyltransferase|tara:strand:- start:450 stop:2987 length:2538 start_codon:yes stop_codon:yes gene_type:complete